MARELGFSQISSLRCLEEIDSLFHKKDSIPHSEFRSHFFPSHRDAGLSSVVDVIHRVFLARGSPQISEPGVSCMQDIVLPMQWVPDLFFSSLRAPRRELWGHFSSGSPFGSLDPIMLTSWRGIFCSSGGGGRVVTHDLTNIDLVVTHDLTNAGLVVSLQLSQPLALENPWVVYYHDNNYTEGDLSRFYKGFYVLETLDLSVINLTLPQVGTPVLLGCHRLAFSDLVFAGGCPLTFSSCSFLFF